jgi:VIT1/CCC1 family predicted Fe2+/Mn2+ transporter
VFLWVFLSTFTVVIPFLLVSDAKLALRLSNGVAILLLFLTGYAFGRHAGRRPWLAGIAVVILGSSLVGIAIALGG